MSDTNSPVEIEYYLSPEYHDNDPIKFLNALREVYQAVSNLKNLSGTIRLGEAVISDVRKRVHKKAFSQFEIFQEHFVPENRKDAFEKDFMLITGLTRKGL